MKKIYLFIFLLMFVTSVSNAATKTWIGGTGTTLNWTTPANWSPVGVPVAGDDVVFSTAGTLTFTTGPAASIAFNSLTISDGAVTITASASRTLTLGGNAGTDFTIASGASLTLGTNISITMASSATGDISGILTVNSGRTFNTNNATVVTTVTGSLVNSGTVTCTTASKLLMQSGSTYTHSQSGGNIPTATWNSASTCNITGVVATFPSNDAQSFGNFIWDCSGQGTNQLQFSGSLTATGTVTVTNTGTIGSGRIELGNASGNNIGNLIINGGTLRMASNTARTLDVSGSVTISSGTLLMSSGNNVGTLNVGGDFSHTGGTIDETSSGSGAIIFNGGTQIFTSGGTVSNTINYTVNSGSTLQMAATGTVVTGNSFTLSSGATIDITSTAGITSSGATGNIQTTTRSYNTGANYRYIGTGGAQVTGNGLPATVNSLTINNASGVSLTNAATANSASSPLTLTSGILSGATLTIGSAYIGAGGGGSASSHVSGSLAKTGSTAYEFPVGNGTVYRPISVSSLSASATITASYTQANPQTAFGTSVGAGINHITKCEYWNLDDGVATITGMVGLKFGGSCNSNPYVDDPSTLRVAHWNGSTWEDKGNNGSATTTSVQGNIATTFSPFTIGSSGVLNPLPVKLSSIKAFEKQQGVQIDWTAYQEENLSRYAVERSANGSTFTSIGEVIARNSASETSYGFFDANPLPGINFYRLKSIDMDSKFSYSAIVKVNLDKNVKDISLYPNPSTGGYISFQGADLAKGNYTIRVYNSAGSQIMNQSFTHTGGAINQTLKLPAGTKSGMYSLQLVSDGVKVMSKTFMVQ